MTGDLISEVASNLFENMSNKFQLFDNYPNPFNPKTKISYIIPSDQLVELKIIDMLGREVNRLVFEQQEQGRYQIEWDGKDQRGNLVASGIYLYQLKAGNYVNTRKLLFLKLMSLL